MKIRTAAVTAAMAVAAAAASPAQAGPASDALGRCMVANTTEQDKSDLAVWVFAAISTHPKVQAYSNFTPAQRDALDRKTAAVMQRLLTVDCRKDTVAALKADGMTALETAFGSLGEAAMGEIISDPSVEQSLGGLANHIDEKGILKLLDEALGKR